MSKYLLILGLLSKLAAAVDNAVRGLPADFAFEYKGKVFKLSLEQMKL